MNPDQKKVQKLLKYAPKLMKLLEEVVGPMSKRPRDDGSDDIDEAPEPEPMIIPLPAAPVAFQCSGHVWETPNTGCGGGPKSDIKSGIMHEKKRFVVCHACKNARDRWERARKKATNPA
jgi:hypothetical protein